MILLKKEFSFIHYRNKYSKVFWERKNIFLLFWIKNKKKRGFQLNYFNIIQILCNKEIFIIFRAMVRDHTWIIFLISYFYSFNCKIKKIEEKKNWLFSIYYLRYLIRISVENNTIKQNYIWIMFRRGFILYIWRRNNIYF